MAIFYIKKNAKEAHQTKIKHRVECKIMKYLAFSLVSKEKTLRMKRGRGVKFVLKSNIYIKKVKVHCKYKNLQPVLRIGVRGGRFKISPWGGGKLRDTIKIKLSVEWISQNF